MELRARQAWALIVVGTAQFVLLLDLTIVNVALPTIQQELGVAHGRLQWLISAYALTFGGFLLLAGRAADVFGRLRMFVVGILIFGTASLAAGLAVNELMLVAARAGQGLGGAAVSPAALALVTTTFREGVERNRALSIFATMASAGAASGLILGGAIAQWAGWRWIFLINVPIAAVAALVAPRVVREERYTVYRPLGVAGAVSSTFALLDFVYGLARGGEAGFGDAASVTALAAAVAGAVVFVVVERGAADPLVPVRLLRVPTLLGTHLTSFAVSTVIAATPFLLTLYMQRVLELSPLVTGLAFLPLTLTVVVTTALAARAAERTGVKRLLLVGVGALVLAALALSRVSAGGSYLTDVLPGMLLFAAGLGASYTGAAIGGTAGVADMDQGVAGGVLNTVKQVGGGIGLAVLALVATGGGGAGEQTETELIGGLRSAFLVALGFLAPAAVAALTVGRTGRGERGLSSPTAERSPSRPGDTPSGAVTSLVVGRR